MGISPNGVDVFGAAYRVAHDFGVSELAARMGVVPGTLYNKLLTHESSHHKLTLQDAILISVITRNPAILQALARTLDHVCIPVCDLKTTSDSDLVEIVSRWMQRQGDFFATFHGALADGRITRDEAAALERDAWPVLAAVLELTQRVQGMIR